MIVNKPKEISLNELMHLGLKTKAQHSLKAIIVHWTSGSYKQVYDTFHLNIDDKGKMYQTCSQLEQTKQHTQYRYLDTIGIALCCGYQAQYKDLNHIYYGPYPPTLDQVEQTAKAIAVLCMTLGLKISYSTVKTHFELAVENSYGPGSSDPHKRWDLVRVPDSANPTDFGLGGLLFRARALYYYNKLLEKSRKAQPLAQGVSPEQTKLFS